MDHNNEQIIKQLNTDSYTTAAKIASVVGLSEKTVRTRIKEMNNELKYCGAKIRSKQNAGFYLEITDQKKYIQWMRQAQEARWERPNTSADRVQYLLAYLLNHSEYVKLDDLCQFLYISRNTLTADLKRSECILNLYNLEINRRPNYGICVTGNEFDRRICIANCLLKGNRMGMDSFKQQDDMKRLADILKSVLYSCSLKVSENSFESMVLHLYVANGRIQRGHEIVFSIEKKEELCKNLRNHAMDAAVKIAREIQNRMGITYSEHEILYIAIHISGKTFPDSSDHNNTNLVISSQIDELVLRMLSVVYECNRIDFRDNLELRMSLNQHMVPFDIRMKYDIPMKNPILEKIKKEYAVAYAIAATACTVLQQHYKKEIPEDELGYFAVLFALAIEKQDKKLDQKNIVVVCVSGRGSSQLFLYKYKQAFGKYINNIYECTLFDLDKFDFVGKKIDYIFSTVPLHGNLPVPVFEISLFLNNEEVDRYRSLFEHGDHAFLRNYYDQRLFIPYLEGETKDEVLKKMCDYIKTVRELPEGFLKSVLLRERMGQTDFGNLVAIAHPYRSMTKTKFVATAILEKPIWWGHNEVQVVLLAALSEEKDEDIERFYQATTNFVFDASAVRRLIASRDYNTLIQLLEGKR